MPKSKRPSKGIGSQPERELLEVINSLQKSSKYTDLTIKCDTQSFEVHQCIVLFQSSVLEERYLREGKLEMEDHPLLVTKMIDYFYTRDYKVDDLDFSASSFKQLTESFIDNSDFCEEDISDISTLLGPLPFHMMMYLLAHSMEISGLKLLAKYHVTRSLVDNITPESFSLYISTIYNTYNLSVGPGHELRDIAVQATIDHRADLRRNVHGNHMVLGNDLLDDIPEFTRDVLIAIMDQGKEVDRGITVSEPPCWGTW